MPTRLVPSRVILASVLGAALGVARLPAADAAQPAAAPPQVHDHGRAPAPAAGGHHHHDHGDHAHPQSLAEGVAEVEQVAARVQDRLAAGDREAADDAVHGMGHVLDDVQGLLDAAQLPAEAAAAARTALDGLFDCFDKLDTALHAEPGSGPTPAEVHASVATRIQDSLQALRAAVTPKPAAAPAAAADVAALRGRLVLAAEPAGALTLTAAKAVLTKDPKPVVVVGRIGAKGVDPFLPDKASFSLLEIPAADAHAAQPGHKPDECPFCKKRAANAPVAAVRFLGADGAEIPVDARKLFGVQAGQDVVIRGQAIFDASLPVQILQITADGIHVRPPAK